MNSITFCVGYVLAVVLFRISNADFDAFSEEKTTHVGPLNFNFDWNNFLLTEITLKNISPSVTGVYLIATYNYKYYPTSSKDEHIKNGEVKIRIEKILTHYNILIDVELETREGLCHTSKVVEGRYSSYNWYSSKGKKTIYWNTDWKYDGTKSCLMPNRCEIVMDLKNLSQENFNCNVKEDKYVCTFQTEKLNNLKSFFYQTYDSDEPRSKATFQEDYTYLEAVGSYYKIHKETKNWYDAKKVCAQEAAILFFPENSDEVNAVMSFWNSKPDDYMWVGISDLKTEGEFVTVDGRLISEVYEKWHPGQPDNYKEKEHCVHIYKSSGYNDISCEENWCSFICKRSLFQNIQHDLSSIIGPPLISSAMTTTLVFELEFFDNNTSVHVATPTSKKIQRSDKLILRADDVVKEHIVSSQVYSETTEVTFSCDEYKAVSKYSYVALISKTKDKIQTFNETQKNRRKFKKADSGSILCCLNYVYESSNDGKELQIKRYVVKKTSLIYKPEIPISPNPAGSQDQASSSVSSDYNWLLYVLSAFLAVSALVLALYMISKQRWFKNSQPVEETVESDAQAQDQVLYASIEFVNNRNQPQIENEESHYANIIGELHPY